MTDSKAYDALPDVQNVLRAFNERGAGALTHEGLVKAIESSLRAARSKAFEQAVAICVKAAEIRGRQERDPAQTLTTKIELTGRMIEASMLAAEIHELAKEEPRHG